MTTRTIRAHVEPQAISEASRYCVDSPRDVLTELLENARRARATRVWLITSANDDGTTTVRVLDDGCGITNPAKLLALRDSGGCTDVAVRGDPTGMGLFSLVGRDVHISSRTAGHDLGWSAQIAGSDWTSGDTVPLRTCVRATGTTVTFAVPEEWTDALQAIVSEAARHYPLPVVFNNETQQSVDFLAKAVSVTDYGGVRVGVFHEIGQRYAREPTLNFHGLTIVHKLPTVEEPGKRSTWYARVDIVDCPALQLTLPARQEIVATPFLDELATAIRIAIYSAIAERGSHRLSFASWSEAAALGVLLPEAAEGLVAFAPATADAAFGRTVPVPRPFERTVTAPRLTGEDLILLDDYGAAAEQTLERALTVSQAAIGRRLVRAEADLEGYGWYDRLCALETMRVIVKQGDTIHVLEPDSAQPDLGDGPADAIALELSLWQQGALQIHQLNTDLLLLPADEYDTDVGAVAIVRDFASGSRPMTPALLRYYLDAAFFLPSDDRDGDSWDTQLRTFRVVSRRLALTLLEGADAATRVAIENAVHHHIASLVPAGHRLALTLADGHVDIALVPVPGADTSIPPD